MKALNKKCFAILVVGTFAFAGLVFAPGSSAKAKDEDTKDNDRIENAGTVVQEILDIPDDIPQDLLDKARCVIVFPSVLKAAFIIGGSYGRGVMTCRTHKDYAGPWGAPTMMALEGGSFGLQIGGQATDFVILVTNNRGADGRRSLELRTKRYRPASARWAYKRATRLQTGSGPHGNA